jgi:demethoxyubiquinone hydroxylase (CLK1/Coq7/Cat5 family)
MSQVTEHSLEQMNSFLRGEISAVETYEQALPAIKTDSTREELQRCEQSHRARVESIRQRIIAKGGKPSEGGGAWATFAKALTGGAKLVGEKAAIQALEAGEDHGLADYRKDREVLDPELRAFVDSELLPAQIKTHGTMSHLKHALS